MKGAAWLGMLLSCACGRIGFDHHGDDENPTALGDGGTSGESGDSDDSGVLGDGGTTSTIDCVDLNLGSIMGANVASGSTSGAGNNYSSCSGDGDDITFGWFAPATGMYRIDTCASAMSLDTVLYVRDGDCTGTQLACNDDACGAGIGVQSRVTVSLQAGQGIVIVVDELFPTGGDTYQLAITPL